MGIHPLANLFLKHIATIHQLAHEVKSNLDSEKVHKLRIETKRMRAILRMVRYYQPNWPYRKYYQPFRDLYHAAGALREIQLQLAMVEEAPLGDEKFRKKYTTFLLQELAKARKRLTKSLQKELPDAASISRYIDMLFKYCEPEDFGLYFRQKTKEMQKLRAAGKQLKKQNIHSLRKALKDYNNNRKNTSKTSIFNPGPTSGLPKTQLDLEGLLGDWNDYQTALIHLEYARKKGLFDKNTPAYEELKQYWNNCSEAIYLQLDQVMRPKEEPT